ncbi:MAG TPA: pyridoxal phosphate-dependent aminotransferase [Thermoanaerobaculia bacterium]|nr:pyridoxal phosphate-dependent aminotransferase [Thermoanaerobaculia bacterium]
MRLASRLDKVSESATLKVTRRAAELRRQGVRVIDFGAGEPDFPSPGCAVEAARGALAEGFTRYTPVAGTPSLREALAERYRRRWGAPWTASQVMVTVGGKAALFELALALFEEGDEVVVPSPWWVSFPEQILLSGALPVAVPARLEDRFRIHADAVLAALSPRTRAVLLNSPCNPTGGMVEMDDLERIAAACAERGIVLISDETYESFVYDGRPPVSAAALAERYPQAIVLVGSFSKTFAMTGWRVGYALGPAAVIEAALRVQGHATSNPTSFAMVGAEAALAGATADLPAMLAEYQARRDQLIPRLEALPGFRCTPPAGAFYAFPDASGCFRGGTDGSVALAEYLLEEAQVAVVPGAAFGDDRHLRISFACSRQDLDEGVSRMEEALARLGS